MTLFEQTIQAFENQDYDLAERIHHEEFMFVREYSMSSREEHLANIQEWFADSTWHKRVECVHEDDFYWLCVPQRLTIAVDHSSQTMCR